MPTAEELRQTITANRAALRATIEAASDRWESGDDDGWSPRRITEHCIDRDIGLGGIAAAAMRGEPAAERFAQTNEPDAPNPCSFATAAEALTALDESGVASDEALRDIEDRDLAKPAELNTGGARPSILESVLWLMGWHLNDNAEQIRKA